MNIFFRTISLMLLFIGFYSTAKGDEKSASNAQVAYIQALNKVISTRKSILNGHKVSFTELSEGQSGGKKSVTKQLYLDATGEEQLDLATANNTGDQQESLSWKSNVLIDPRRFPSNAELISETETTWVFSIPTQVNADLENFEQEVDSALVNEELMSALASELTVSKISPHFLSQRIYSTHPFKPDSLVEVTEFNVRLEFTQAWQEGPWVTKSMSRTVKGSYAFFINVDEFSIVSYSDFKLIN